MLDSEVIAAAFDATIALHQHVKRADTRPISLAVVAIIESIQQGGKVLTFGNGGSAADAQHLASELLGRFERERRALPAVALTTDTSVLTSIANDYTFDRAFARQVDGLGRSGDVAFGISTSGASSNVVTALLRAREKGLRTIALTGRDGGLVGRAAEIHVNVPSDSTARVQEVHRTLLHVICDLVERAFVD